MLCAFAFPAFAQLNINTVDPGPYTPGSSIATTFTIDANTPSCISQNNIFQLYLSNETGDFNTETLIGTYSSFYSTFVNGTLPNVLIPGTGYRLRIKASSNPALVSAPSAPFVVVAGTPVTAKLISNKTLDNAKDAFGFCSAQIGPAADVLLSNQSTAGSATIKLIHEIDQTSTTSPITTQIIFNAEKTHYTAFLRVINSDGNVATRAYFIVNNEAITAFTTKGNNVVCLSGNLTYDIDVSLKGIGGNFPGNTYKINWGDGAESSYTYCDLKSGQVQHLYTQSSCGQSFISGNNTIYNAFGINVSVASPFCGNIGTPISTTAKVITITQNFIAGANLGCTNSPITFSNASVLGQDPETNSPGCEEYNSLFNWYVDGNLILAGVPKSTNLTHTFIVNGPHVIKLESINNGNCVGPIATHNICIQNPPKPSFTLPTNTICAGSSLVPTNTSVVDETCNNNTTYTWAVSPSIGVSYLNGTNANSKTPEFVFANAGAYDITVSINTESCNAATAVTQTVVVNTIPTAILSPDAILCGTGTYAFDNTVASVTRTTFTGSTSPEVTDTYTWTVTPANGGTWAFTAGTTTNSKYPSIRFDNYDTYTVTVTHKNNCGTVTTSQKLTFNTAPIVNAGTDQRICYNDASFTLAGSITGSVNSQVWTSTGGGTFLPNANTLNATYTPTPAEKNAGTVTLTLTATTSLPSPCNLVADQVVLIIKPQTIVNSPTNKRICTGAPVNYTLSSNIAGATFSWTASSTTVTGFSPTGNGNTINDILNNNSPINDGTVTYTIIPSSDGCPGDPFSFTVTVTPLPISTVTLTNLVICSQQVAGITLASNLPNTKYTWTSLAAPGITGNTTQTNKSTTTSINDVLINNLTTPANVTYTFTPYSINDCPGTPVTVTITVAPSPSTPNAGIDESICNSNAYILKGNEPQVGNGKWTEFSNIGGLTFVDDTKYNTTVNGLIPGNTYIFRWTITGSASCTPKFDEVAITVNPPSVGGTTTGDYTVCANNNSGQITLSGNTGNILRWESTADGGITWLPISNNTTDLTYNNLATTTQYRGVIQNGTCPITYSSTTTITVNPTVVTANAGADQELCNQTTTTLAGNSPLTNVGLWTQTSGPAGASFADASLYNTQVNHLIAGHTYTFTWTISGLAPCQPSSSSVTVKVNAASEGGLSAGGANVCFGNSNGNITLSGQVGSILRWESSTDAGITWQSISNTTPILPYANLISTTQYRAVVQNGNCAPVYSSVSTITVNPASIIAIAGADQELCNQTTTTLAGNSPQTQTGLWTQTSGPAGATFIDPTLYNTSVSGLIPGNTYIFTWSISGLAPCSPSSSNVSIKVNALSNGGTTAGGTTVCSGNNNGLITLSEQTGNVIWWESSIDAGASWTPISNTTTNLPYLNLSQSTHYRAVVQNGNCTIANSTTTTIMVNQAVTQARAGLDQILCNANTITLGGNAPLGNTGLWTLTSGQSGISFTDNTLYDTQVNGLVGGENYTFRWTISGLAPCPATNDEVTITNLAPITNHNINTSFLTVCNGQAITLTGNTPTGGNGVYSYVWEHSLDGTTWSTMNGQTGSNLNVTVVSSLAYRRIVNSGNCAAISNVLNVTALPPIANNTIIGNQTSCIGNIPSPAMGSQPIGGNGSNYDYTWEQSIDNGTTWSTIIDANTQNYSPTALTQTTMYRRLVSSGACTGSFQNISNTIKVVANPNAKADFTYTTDLGCIPFVIDAYNIKAIPYPDRNATYSWYANGVNIGTGINFPGYSLLTDNSTVAIKLVVTSSLGCSEDEMSHSFSTRQNVIAAFNASATNGCGPLTLDFTNTSTTTTGATFEWRVNNVIVATTPDLRHTFNADVFGEDKDYMLTLTVITPCGRSVSTPSKITVYSQAIATGTPDKTKGCSPLLVNFRNTSPGSTNTYTYEIDGIVVAGPGTNQSDFSWTFTSDVVREYKVKVTATNSCDSDFKEYTIVVSPNTINAALTVDGNKLRGCAPFDVNFINNTIGASQYIYHFEPNQSPEISFNNKPEIKHHRFEQAGTYIVTMLASNDCSIAPLKTIEIIVDPKPIVAFSANLTTGCSGMSVKFTNTSTNAISYQWDFGDGNTSTAANPTYVYSSGPGAYTVSLTAINAFGCTDTKTITNYIRIVPPPIADFNISPAAVVSIPTYTFKFIDASTNEPQTYKWTFGDGDESSLKDPTHKYADTGKYLVTMRTYNEYGCVDSIQKAVQIVGVPGYVYLPNSFIPGGTSSPLQKFTAIGAGIKSWHMSIYNKWGQTIWETTKLDDGKPIEGWDGTYKGIEQPQGIYFWKLEVELINGTEWKGMTYGTKPPKRTGEIYLIR